MLRAILFAVAGQVYFVLSLFLMMPLRMKPVENYNLFLMPFLAVLFFFLFYRTCVEEKTSKAFGYGFFSGIVLWQLIGEISSVPVPKGVITQYANLELKVLGGYFFVVAGWLMLKVLWRTKAIKNSVAVAFMTFLGIWTFELYMHNYSAHVPLEMMPKVANVVLAIFIVLAIIILIVAKKAGTPEKRTVMGVLLYLTLSVIMMSSGQWRKPMTFYMTHEAEHLEHQIQEMQQELEYINNLKAQMDREDAGQEEPEGEETEGAQ
jgi:hypothetical protein